MSMGITGCILRETEMFCYIWGVKRDLMFLWRLFSWRVIRYSWAYFQLFINVELEGILPSHVHFETSSQCFLFYIKKIISSAVRLWLQLLVMLICLWDIYTSYSFGCLKQVHYLVLKQCTSRNIRLDLGPFLNSHWKFKLHNFFEMQVYTNYSVCSFS